MLEALAASQQVIVRDIGVFDPWLKEDVYKRQIANNPSIKLNFNDETHSLLWTMPNLALRVSFLLN